MINMLLFGRKPFAGGKPKETVSMVGKVGLTLALGGLLLATAGCGGSNKKTVTVDTAIKKTLEDYFTTYFESQKSLSYSKMGTSLLTDNENTQLNEAFRKTLVVQETLFNSGIADYQYKINYQNCTVNSDVATVVLTLDLDFQYQDAPDDLKSGIHNVDYDFSLKKDGSQWVITEIESDLNEYQNFKSQVETQMAQNAVLSKSEAITEVAENIQSELRQIRNNSIYLEGDPTATTATEESATTSSTESATENTAITKSAYLSCQEYDYSSSAAVDYAVTYAEADDDDRIFYTTQYDCTNFISQCIWAGYVGFTSETTAQSNIANMTGMIYTEWHATKYGISDIWSNVDELYDYLSDDTKAVGPKVTVYNNGGRYTGVAADSINVGDVLQVRDGYGTNYSHSVFVTKTKSNVSSYNDIYICSHTNDRCNVKLYSVVIRGFGGSNCYMRRLVPQSGCYMK